mgnify:CR=1 FL=1
MSSAGEGGGGGGGGSLFRATLRPLSTASSTSVKEGGGEEKKETMSKETKSRETPKQTPKATNLKYGPPRPGDLCISGNGSDYSRHWRNAPRLAQVLLPADLPEPAARGVSNSGVENDVQILVQYGQTGNFVQEFTISLNDLRLATPEEIEHARTYWTVQCEEEQRRKKKNQTKTVGDRRRERKDLQDRRNRNKRLF